jgi:cbb3-type cytochrome oxidase subunit 3
MDAIRWVFDNFVLTIILVVGFIVAINLIFMKKNKETFNREKERVQAERREEHEQAERHRRGEDD